MNRGSLVCISNRFECRYDHDFELLTLFSEVNNNSSGKSIELKICLYRFFRMNLIVTLLHNIVSLFILN